MLTDDLVVDSRDSDRLSGFAGSTSGSGVETPNIRDTASQELLNRDGSALVFADSAVAGSTVAGSTGGSAETIGSGTNGLGGLSAESVFLVVGLSDGVLSKFAMLFQ